MSGLEPWLEPPWPEPPCLKPLLELWLESWLEPWLEPPWLDPLARTMARTGGGAWTPAFMKVFVRTCRIREWEVYVETIRLWYVQSIVHPRCYTSTDSLSP
jgi:hypothetical protein